MNAIQFNALAILFILGILPFSVAFITNAGSSSDGVFQSSNSTQNGFQNSNGSYWYDNGGTNFTADYVNETPSISGTYFEDCVYVVEGSCEGNTLNNSMLVNYVNFAFSDAILPMTSASLFGSHYYGDTSATQYYTGSSGDGPFGWVFRSAYFNDIDNGSTIDKLRFTFVNTEVSYACNSAIFTNISFDGSINFYYETTTLSFDGFEFETSNKYEYEAYDRHLNTWSVVCQVGFSITFDLTGFESIQLYEMNKGYWDSTRIYVDLDNFVNEERTNSFGSTALPFACNCNFRLGIEHQETNPVQANFIIKSGTLFLSLGTFAIAVASTPYWDPFRNLFKGMLE